MFSFIGWLIIGGLAGWLASKMMGTDRQQGVLTDIFLGILGAVLGGFLVGLFGIGEGAGYQGFNLFSLITALLGAVLLLWLRKQMAART